MHFTFFDVLRSLSLRFHGMSFNLFKVSFQSVHLPKNLFDCVCTAIVQNVAQQCVNEALTSVYKFSNYVFNI